MEDRLRRKSVLDEDVRDVRECEVDHDGWDGECSGMIESVRECSRMSRAERARAERARAERARAEAEVVFLIEFVVQSWSMMCCHTFKQF